MVTFWGAGHFPTRAPIFGKRGVWTALWGLADSLVLGWLVVGTVLDVSAERTGLESNVWFMWHVLPYPMYHFQKLQSIEQVLGSSMSIKWTVVLVSGFGNRWGVEAGLGSHLMVLMSYSWLCVQGVALDGAQRSNLDQLHVKHLLAVLSLWAWNEQFLFWFDPFKG